MPRDTSSRAIPGVSLQKRGAAWPSLSAGTPIPTPSHALPRFSAFVRIRVSTVSHCELVSRGMFARDHVAPTELAQKHSCEYAIRTPAVGAHAGTDVLQSGPSEACRANVRWANAPQAGDTGLGMGVPKPRLRTNHPEVRLPGVPTGTRAERRCLRVRVRPQRLIANEPVSRHRCDMTK